MRTVKIKEDTKGVIGLAFMVLVFIAFMFFMAAPLWANEPPYEISWARQKGGTGNDIAYGIAANLAGGIYITGNAGASIDGQPYSGVNDLFLMKYDLNGNWIWTRQLGTAGSEWANAVAVVKNQSGDVYVVGRTSGALDGNTSAGQTDAFIVKYSSNGNKLWSRMIGSNRQDLAYAAGIDSSGNIYITGRTNGALPGHTTLGANDMFLVKYDPNGNRLWSRQVGTAGDDEAFALIIDNEDRVYIGGYTTGSHGGPNTGGKDMLVMRFDSNGTFCCSKQYGTAVDDIATALAIDSFGYIYILGNRGSTAAVLMKCDSYGTIWTIDLEMQIDEIVSSMTIDQMNNIYVTGHANINRGGIIDKDVSIAKYDPNGQFIWSRQTGTNVDDKANSVAVDEYGSIYVTGSTNGSLFAANAGGSDVFVLKLSDAAPSTGGVKINSDAVYANSTSVILSIACSDMTGSGCRDMRLSNDNLNWTDWINQMTASSWTATRPWTMPSVDGTKTVYLQFRDLAGNISESFSDSIILDETIPSGSITINNGDDFTNSEVVNMAVSCSDSLSGCSQARFSNNNVNWSGWESYTGNKVWRLSGGDGLKTVYVQFRDAAGNASLIQSDTIALDTTMLAGTILINEGDAYTNSPSVALSLSCVDAQSGCASMQFSNDNVLWSGWEAFKTIKMWQLNGGDGIRTIYIRLKDRAGNISPSVSSFITLHTTLLPDLAVSSINAPVFAGSGSTITISDTTKNMGIGGTGRSTTAFYFSFDRRLDEDDEFIGMRMAPSLAPGGSHTAASSVTLPPDLDTGTYFIIAVADDSYIVNEAKEGNNIISRPINIGPDLSISSINAPSRAGAGASITITSATTNIGQGYAEESTTRFYLSQDRTLSDDDIELGSRHVPTLLGGAISSDSTQVYIPADIDNRAYFIIAKADADDDVTELNERNNTRNRRITIGLDLTISSISAPSNALSGSNIAITVTTANRGPGASPPVITRLYLSEDNVLSEDDIELDELQIESLSPGSGTVRTVYIEAPDDTATYFIIAKADADDEITELNERNNIRSRRINITERR